MPNSTKNVYNEIITIAAKTRPLLLERLSSLSLQPQRILIIDPKIEVLYSLLQTQYKQANIENTTIDLLSNLTFPHAHFDLIIANLDWSRTLDIEKTAFEAKRVLHPNGTLMLTTLGPYAIQDLQFDFPAAIDMHDLGDILLKAGFTNPVMDREQLSTEVIFGYARGAQSQRLENGEVTVPVSSIKKLHS